MKSIISSLLRPAGGLASLLAAHLLAAAEPGVTDTEVKVGMANALTGNSAALGLGMSAGAKAFFDQLNASGGVQGRKVALISKDDGYEPDRCVAQTKELIETDKVFSLLGYVGTPTATAIMPLLGQNPDLVFLAPFTGAEFLRNPVKKNVFNIRASYFDETEALVQRLTEDLAIKEIGVFIQDDAFGAAGEAGVQKALRKRNLTLAGKGTYKRNTVDVADGLNLLKQGNPKAVIMVGTYKACAAFIKAAKAGGVKAVFCNISFVGTSALIKELGSEGEGVVISQVLPSPTDASMPVVKEYQAAMKAAGREEFDYTSLEGYIAALVYAEALKKAGKDLTRGGFLGALENLKTSLGGLEVEFSAASHQALKRVYLTVVRDGKATPVTDFKAVTVAAK